MGFEGIFFFFGISRSTGELGALDTKHCHVTLRHDIVRGALNPPKPNAKQLQVAIDEDSNLLKTSVNFYFILRTFSPSHTHQESGCQTASDGSPSAAAEWQLRHVEHTSPVSGAAREDRSD